MLLDILVLSQSVSEVIRVNVPEAPSQTLTSDAILSTVKNSQFTAKELGDMMKETDPASVTLIRPENGRFSKRYPDSWLIEQDVPILYANSNILDDLCLEQAQDIDLVIEIGAYCCPPGFYVARFFTDKHRWYDSFY